MKVTFRILMVRILVSIQVILLSALAVKAQSPGPGRGNDHFSVSIHPFQIINKGHRVDMEIRVKDTRHWLLAGPQAYAGNIVKRENIFSEGIWHKLSGYGIELGHKIILDSGRSVYTYVMYGGAFHSFTIRYMGMSWMTFMEDGITYYRYANGVQKEKIQRWSGVITTGVHLPLRRSLFADFYLGIGIRKSGIKATTDTYPVYDGLLQYGYTGVYPIAGFKLGVRF